MRAPRAIRRNAWLAIAPIALAGMALAAPPVVVETLDEQLSGRLSDLSEAWIVLEGDTFARLQRDEVLAIRFEFGRPRRAQESLPSEVTLIDGSRFAYTRAEVRGETVRFERPEGSTLETPVASIHRWRVERKLSEGTGGEGPVADRLLVKSRSGDSVTPVDGVVLGVTADGVRFALDGAENADPVQAPWRRLAEVRFFREAGDPPPPRTALTLRDGGRLVADRLQINSDGGVAFASVLGSQGVVDLGQIESIDLSGGRVHRVAALPVLHTEWRPYFDGPTGRRGHVLGESLSGTPLGLRFPDPRLPGGWPGVSVKRSFDSGVALRSRGEVRLALPPRARRLKGWIGLDPLAARAGSAEVQVMADERTVWSGVVDGMTRPVELNGALLGERALTLRVDYGDNLDAGDQVHFADLRVIQ